MIRCPTCGNDLVYSPIPPLYFCLELMIGENITINLKCKPWIPEDAPIADLLKLTERVEKLAPELRAQAVLLKDSVAGFDAVQKMEPLSVLSQEKELMILAILVSDSQNRTAE